MHKKYEVARKTKGVDVDENTDAAEDDEKKIK
jgi:hypothetical protein